MAKADKIIEVARVNNGYITTKEVKKLNINTAELTKLVRQKKLERISRGYYSIPNGYADNFYIILSKCKKAIFSNATALYFHDLADRIPLVYDIAVPYGYGNCYKNMENICLHYIKNENINLGMIEIESPFGMKIRTYDMERTICDIIKNKNHMDIEVFTKALQRYSRLRTKNLNKLMRYAKKLKVDEKVREYMQILL